MPRSRIGRLAVAAVSLLWLAYAVALDLRYRRFPEVLLGAVQILLAFYLLLGLATLAGRGVRRLRRGSSEADR
jgi:hypothetical protein